MSAALGSYLPHDTFFHRIDPRVKFFVVIAFIISVFLPLAPGAWGTIFIFDGLLFITVLLAMILSKISILSILNSFKTLWLLVLILLVFNIFVPASGVITNPDWGFYIGNFLVKWESLLWTGMIFLRLIIMFSLTIVLTGTTKPLDLNYAIEWYMYPLKLVRFPVHIVSMTTSLALRFVPTLMDETKQLMKAQSSRGLDYNKGSISARFRGIIALVIPLFVSAFTRSIELANAMIARGYDPYGKRTRYRKLSFHYRDLFVFLFAFIVLGGFITMSVMKVDVFQSFVDWVSGL